MNTNTDVSSKGGLLQLLVCPSNYVKGLVKKYRGGGPEHLEIWLIKNT